MIEALIPLSGPQLGQLAQWGGLAVVFVAFLAVARKRPRREL